MINNVPHSPQPATLFSLFYAPCRFMRLSLYVTTAKSGIDVDVQKHPTRCTSTVHGARHAAARRAVMVLWTNGGGGFLSGSALALRAQAWMRPFRAASRHLSSSKARPCRRRRIKAPIGRALCTPSNCYATYHHTLELFCP